MSLHRPTGTPGRKSRSHGSALTTRHSALFQRLVSAAIGLPTLLIPVWIGGWVYVLLVLVAALWAALEFLTMARRAGHVPSPWIVVGGTVALTLGPLWPGTGPESLTMVVLTLVVLGSLAWLIHRASVASLTLTDFLLSLGGPLYLGWLFSYLIWLHLLPNGQSWVALVLLATFAADTAAYLVGRRWGKHKLAPAVSPNKTGEGAIAGFVAGLLVAWALAWLLPLPLTWWQAFAVGALLSLAGQLGDLAESALKRNFQAKDAGSLIPGHGGILDRADSLLPASVVVYYAVRLLGSSS